MSVGLAVFLQPTVAARLTLQLALCRCAEWLSGRLESLSLEVHGQIESYDADPERSCLLVHRRLVLPTSGIQQRAFRKAVQPPFLLSFVNTMLNLLIFQRALIAAELH